METKYMIGATAKFWKRYTFPPMTPIEGAPTMDVRLMTKADATAYATKEANEIARERGLPFGKAYHTLLDANPLLKEAVAGIGPVSEHDKLVRTYQQAGKSDEEARRAAGLDPRAARRHVDQAVAMKLRSARQAGRTLSYSQAMQAAMDEAPEIAERAGLLAPQGTTLNAGTEAMARFYSGQTVPEDVLKRCYGAGSGPSETTHEAALRKSRDVAIRQIASDVMFRGLAQPDAHAREWADHYFAVLNPPPVPVSGTNNQAAMNRYNATREAFIDTVLAEARRLLADPAERAKLTPMRLGS